MRIALGALRRLFDVYVKWRTAWFEFGIDATTLLTMHKRLESRERYPV